MATLVLNLSTIRFVYAPAIGSVDSTNRVRKLRLELTILPSRNPHVYQNFALIREGDDTGNTHVIYKVVGVLTSVD
ncbi:hypothetical protein PF005_g28088 [Phytophthora fragariae]|uniref:Uncharacterized protein n=1 Tax=Phytophthora fragariae TaxID=53985 RepID=A0A6A3VNI1_9STRA|nr:hypothetical protein PF003_g24842 [Phytophthora fragariae]KAE8917432.1 hypothetical protein PF009_g32246 [Phytophthora fragariae]KAE8956282.1 hypothetical protein PF011_g31533 [Phytophthora fragariae]KAE9056481.1 hypothetical protein PF010_g31753 [Phytophthora fragariae]KAE9056931.1 hypothetical protein PF007_g31822 [Phytophthora fragariae]